jgi:hypothetical protein
VNDDNKVDELQKPVGSVSVLASEEEPRDPADTAFVQAQLGIDTGDVVKHKPTGEEWIVAFVEGDRLAWLGWPEGTANLSDCTLIEKAQFQRRIYWLRQMAMSSGRRAQYAREMLASEGLPIVEPASIDDDFDDEPLPARTCAIDGEECESCQ